jgi:hypothetical protein
MYDVVQCMFGAAAAARAPLCYASFCARDTQRAMYCPKERDEGVIVALSYPPSMDWRATGGISVGCGLVAGALHCDVCVLGPMCITYTCGTNRNLTLHLRASLRVAQRAHTFHHPPRHQRSTAGSHTPIPLASHAPMHPSARASQ